MVIGFVFAWRFLESIPFFFTLVCRKGSCRDRQGSTVQSTYEKIVPFSVSPSSRFDRTGTC